MWNAGFSLRDCKGTVVSEVFVYLRGLYRLRDCLVRYARILKCSLCLVCDIRKDLLGAMWLVGITDNVSGLLIASGCQTQLGFPYYLHFSEICWSDVAIMIEMIGRRLCVWFVFKLVQVGCDYYL